MKRGERYSAHRTAFEVANGIIDPDLLVCHSCDNPPCCNARHHFQGTHGDNARDKWAKGRGFTPFNEMKQIGEDHPGAKLDADTVRLIRRLRDDDHLKLGNYTLDSLTELR
jgi:hypothetical protein